jgi:hypothetical protein
MMDIKLIDSFTKWRLQMKNKRKAICLLVFVLINTLFLFSACDFTVKYPVTYYENYERNGNQYSEPENYYSWQSITLIEKPNNFANENKTFIGWYRYERYADGHELAYAPGTKLYKPGDVVQIGGEQAYFYAAWE